MPTMKAMTDVGGPDDSPGMMEKPAAVPPDEAPEPGGYVLEIKVLADGTFLLKKMAMHTEPAEAAAEGEEVGESYDSLNDLLKGVIKMVKDNPTGNDGQFEAGFGERKGIPPANPGPAAY